MSVDVEDWFQTASFARVIKKSDWDDYPLRVERNVDLILSILQEKEVKCTFFILGWIAERAPAVVHAIQSSGLHEVACHGYHHDCLYDLSQSDFREDVRRSKGLLEDISGVQVVGYRAPNFSITNWALEILQEEGFEYDSSYFPAALHDRYGRLGDQVPVDQPLFDIRKGLREFSMLRAPFFGKEIPWAGGGYFRLLPYSLFKIGISRIFQKFGTYNFYIHPWEFDPDQPRFNDGMKKTDYFRHYNNIASTEAKFRKMIRDFSFTSMEDYLVT